MRRVAQSLDSLDLSAVRRVVEEHGYAINSLVSGLLPSKPVTLSALSVSDLALPAAGIIPIVSSVATVIHGIISDYPVIYLVNTGATTLTLAHQSATAQGANRIISADGGDISLAGGRSAVFFRDGDKWREIR